MLMVYCNFLYLFTILQRFFWIKFYAEHQSDIVYDLIYFMSALIQILLYATNKITRDCLQKDQK